MVASVTAISGSPRLGMAMILLFLLGGLAVLWSTPYPADKHLLSPPRLRGGDVGEADR